MAQAPNNIVKPYTEVQKSPDIPNEEEHENMVSVLGRFVGPGERVYARHLCCAVCPACFMTMPRLLVV